MKIAIASVEKNQNSQISSRAGRAPYFLIFENKKLIEIWKNPFSVGSGGAGFGVAKIMSEKGVEKIIAGKFGDNFISALDDYKVNYMEAAGDIKEYI